jgi:ABC-type sugar transport system ATPase subunit
VQDVNLSVRASEIVGLGGLQGSGASDLLMGLFGGYGHATGGAVWWEGKPAPFRSPRAAIDAGVALLTNDRKATGLVLSLSIVANAVLADLPRLSPGGWRRPRQERAAASAVLAPLRLRTASVDAEVGALSGGNQQKVVLGKWLQTRPRLLLLDEPTRGIDVGAKHEIYQLMDTWTAQGISILLITSEMPELLALSDRVIVMHRGRMTAEFSRAAATPEGVLRAAMGSPASKAEREP